MSTISSNNTETGAESRSREKVESKRPLASLNSPIEALPEPQPAEASLILQQSQNFVAMIGSGLGYDMKYDWEKNNRRYVFTKSVAAFIWVLMFYTQALYVNQHAIVRTIEVFALYGIAISCVLKLHCFQTYFKNMAALYKSTLKICQQSFGPQGQKLQARLIENFNYYKFIAFVAIPVTLVYLYYPVKSYVIDGELVPFVPLEIMFVDQSTLSGYCIASGVMVFVGVLAVLGTEYMGLTFVVIIMNYGPRVVILEENFNQLDEMWCDASISKTPRTTIAYRHMFLRNICRKIIDMRHYVAEIKTIFDQKMFLFFIVAYLSQILCLYQIRANNWVPGYALAIGFFLEMIFYCIMGTKLSIENERLFYIISQSKWYMYDLKSQKCILFLLNIALNSDELWIGPLKPLSVYTATEIIKSIYSYYTIMMEVV